MFLQCGTRALVLCIQGYLMKNLLFAREYSSSFGTKRSVYVQVFSPSGDSN